MTKIFISYRRDDSGFAADRVHEAALDYVTDPKDVFMDIDGIPPGVDFVDHINAKVGQCDVLFALMGRDWLDARDAETGARRLDDPGDFVRAEIAAALARDIPVVPVLLGETHMPHADQLPENLKPLARRNAVRIDRQSFKGDVAQLMAGLGITPVDAPKAKRSNGVLWLALLVAVAAVAGVGLVKSGLISGPDAPVEEPGTAIVLDPEPAVVPGETRTRRLGLTFLQYGDPIELDPVMDSQGAVDRTVVRLDHAPFQMRVPGSHWDSTTTDWPLVRLVMSDSPELFGELDRNHTVEDESPFFWACTYASYEFGSPEVLLARMGEGPNGIACGNNAYDADQIQDVTTGSRTLTISNVLDPDDESEQNLLESAERLYMIVYITERADTGDFEASASYEISYNEVEFIELAFE